MEKASYRAKSSLKLCVTGNDQIGKFVAVIVRCSLNAFHLKNFIKQSIVTLGMSKSFKNNVSFNYFIVASYDFTLARLEASIN